jgi:conjugal transfer pilus assembly protein TraK
MFNRGVVLALILMPVIGQAEQRLILREGGNATANISASSLNRIAVQGDRIATIKGTTGQFHLEKDLSLGQIFMQPSLPEDKTPIHVYITTEKGSTYSLTLLSNEMPAENVILVSASNNQAGVANWDKTASYETVIVNLIKAMHNQEMVEGFSQSEVTKNTYKIKGLQIKNSDVYTGDKLQGLSYDIENISDEELNIKESDFYKQGVRAISILNTSLAPQGKTKLYIVRGV